MPIRVLLTLCGCACLIAAALPSAAAAEPVLAELRVEGPAGTMDPGTWYVTDTEQIRASRPGDACIRDTGRLEFAGPTALGIVQSGSESTAALRQVRVRQDEAGPFVCEIGDILGRPFGDPNGFSGWLFWFNQVSGSSSADLVPLVDGDQVLWVYSDYGPSMSNTGDALELVNVPAVDTDGTFDVSVVAHSFDGTATPVSNAQIIGATTATPLGNGQYTVTVPEGQTTLTASRGTDIQSNHETACVDADPAACPSEHGRTIFGSENGDRLTGTAGWDTIGGNAGDDRINIRSGGADRVDCGGGTDKVIRKGGDDDDKIKRNCERIRKR